ncbi:hypothetical protein [Chryseobacterium cucumeris]|uniref:hypothetical protein n=1 Tax=Chryseobacterium cucumeris TaxID=1813611 RepID=UPI002454F443|nr:hypothetical protein [Chryseobacterium cucumeris]MDH5032439.1 hypothetical protein [Chryseobacterium cucumeris]
MNKGEIFKARDKRNHPHPIVFLERLSESKFSACILSTKDTEGNIPMSEEHFLNLDENARAYSIIYNNSHLVPYRLFKKEDLWLESNEPCGKLSEKGIEFIEKYTKDTNLEFHPVPIWENG